MSEQNVTENAYWSKDVAQNLEIGDSTVRKWCLALENEGYTFLRGHNRSRAFTEKDIINLRRMKSLVHEKKITLEEASKMIVSSLFTEGRTTSALDEQPLLPPDKNRYMTTEQGNEIIERLKQQEQFNKALLEQLNKQQKYIEDSLHKRDQQLIESLRESQETRKLIAAAQEEEKEKATNKKWWQKIFK